MEDQEGESAPSSHNMATSAWSGQRLNEIRISLLHTTYVEERRKLVW